MTAIYRIRDWDQNFETAQSRKVSGLRWVGMPNKQHGMGLTRILAQQDGSAIYGMWCLIVGACSQQRAPREGWLTDDGTAAGMPWTIADLAERWRRDASEVARCMDVLTSHKVGWIEQLDDPRSALPARSQQGGADLPIQVQSSPGESSRGGEDRTAAQAPTPPPAKSLTQQQDENKREIRIMLVRKRFAASGDALEEWIGLVYEDCRCKTMADMRDCISWMKVEGTRRGINGRYAREYQVLASVWKERQAVRSKAVTQ